MVHYARPYFEANVKALETVAIYDWTPSSEGLISLMKGGKMMKGQKGRFASSDPSPYANSSPRPLTSHFLRPPVNPIPSDPRPHTPALPSTPSTSSSFRSHTYTRSNTNQSSGPTCPVDDESCQCDGGNLIKRVYERWNGDLGGGMRQLDVKTLACRPQMSAPVSTISMRKLSRKLERGKSQAM